MTESTINARESVTKAMSQIGTAIRELKEQQEHLGELAKKLETKPREYPLNCINDAIIGKGAYENGKEFCLVSLARLRPDVVGRTVNAIFDAAGWQVHLWEDGFQVYFGKGVSVDNYYEILFPYYPYDLDAFMGWVDSFYEYRLYKIYAD